MNAIVTIILALLAAAAIAITWKNRRQWQSSNNWGLWTDWVSGKVSGEVARRNAIRLKCFVITISSMTILGGFSYYFDYGQFFRQYFGVEQAALISGALLCLSVFGITVFFRILFSTPRKDWFDATVMVIAMVVSISATVFSSAINVVVTLEKKDAKLARDTGIDADIEKWRKHRDNLFSQAGKLVPDGQFTGVRTREGILAGINQAESTIAELELKLVQRKSITYYLTGYIPGFAPVLPLLMVLWVVYERKRAGLYAEFKKDEKPKQVVRDMAPEQKPVVAKRNDMAAPKLRMTTGEKSRRDAFKEFKEIYGRGEFIEGSAGRPAKGESAGTLANLRKKHRLNEAGAKALDRWAKNFMAEQKGMDKTRQSEQETGQDENLTNDYDRTVVEFLNVVDKENGNGKAG